MSAKRGLSARNSRVTPCTFAAPSSMSRSGFTYAWKCRSVMRRLMISTQPISMIRSPSLALSPVVSVSRTICLAVIFQFSARYPSVRQSVGPLVLRVPGVPPHPMPFDPVRGRELVQALPQVDVLDRLLVRGPPVTPLPVVHPFRDAFLHILRIGEHARPARLLQGLQRPDHRRQLHAVVGRVGFTAPELFFRLVKAQKNPPTARSGGSPAGAVAVNLDDLFIHGDSCATFAERPPGRGGAPAPCATPGSRCECREPALPRARHKCRLLWATSGRPPFP